LKVEPPMQFPLARVEGFENRQLVLEMDSVFSAPRLYMDGKSVSAGPGRGTFTLQRADGNVITAVVRHRMLDPIPQLIIQGRVVRAGEPFRWYEWIPILLPVLMAGFDVVGAMIGALGIWLNARVMRMPRPVWQRFALAVGVMLGAIALYLVLFWILNRFSAGGNG